MQDPYIETRGTAYSLGKPSTMRPSIDRDRIPAPTIARTPVSVSWSGIAWMILGIGIVERLLRYALAFPLYYDEYMLAENFLTRGYAEILRPLDNLQVSPPLFLGLELAVTKLFGFSEYSLRLVPLMSGIGALVCFKRLVGWVLSGPGHALAVAFLACAYYPIRHSAEVKPYSLDLFVAVGLSALAVEWWNNRGRTRWLWVLAAVTPLAIGLSFTAVFVAGGISLLTVYGMMRNRDRAEVFAAVAFHASLAASLGAVVALSAGHQLEKWGPAMRDYWANAFPPSLAQPWLLLKWLAATYSGEMFAYPLGAKAGGSTVTFLCFLCGLVIAIRRGQRPLVAMLAAPFALGLVCSALGIYPYGDNERLVQYLGPAICLFAGAGAGALISLAAPAAWPRIVRFLIVFLAIGAFCHMVLDVMHPYKHRWDRDYQCFAQWFWGGGDGSAALVAAPRSVNAAIYPETAYSSYACYQAIYQGNASADPGDHRGPLDFVVFHSGEEQPNQQALDAWLTRFEERYHLTGTTRHRVKTAVGPMHGAHDWHVYDVYHLVPAGEPTSDPRTSPPAKQ